MHVLLHRAALLIGIAAGFLPTAPLHAASTNYSAGVNGSVPSTPRPVGVDDLVTMTRLVEPNASLTGYVPLVVSLAPDGRHFAYVTQTGDLATGQNIYRLVVVETRASLDYINGRAALPVGRIVMTVRSGGNLSAMSHLQWLNDGRQLGFVANGSGDVQQAYSYDLSTGTIEQLTRHPRRVETFKASADGQRIVYTATIPNRLDAWDRPSFPLGDTNIHQLIQQGRENIVPKYSVYVAHAGSLGAPTDLRIALPPATGQLPAYDLSPDGRRLIINTLLPVAPDKQALLPGGILGSPTESEHCPEAPTQMCWTQFLMIDLETGKRTALPVGLSPGIITGETAVRWIDDDHAIIAAAYPPLETTPASQLKPFVYEVDLTTGQAKPIVSIAHDPTTFARLMAVDLERGADTRLTLSRMFPGQSAPRRLAFQRTQGGEWRPVAPADTPQAIRLSMVQDYNQPPEIAGEDPATGRRQVLTNLNPQFAALRFGHADEVTWTDPKGRPWHANLTLPVGYQKGTRYPLVIQTHGYVPHTFVAEGPSPGPHAAQPLAGAGMVVVQMDGIAEGFGTRLELINNRLAIESLIDTLDRQGLIDRDRVGLIGWSGLGLTVDYMMAFSKYRIRAATSADGDSASMFGYGAEMNRGGTQTLLYYEGLNDAHPWGDKLADWVANAPVFHLDKTSTALLIEQLGGNIVSPYWDTFSILKRLGKPVDWYVYPDGTHVLVKPRERQASMQLNVDWYRFWLKNEEDPNPAKADQYRRWRAMKR